MGTAQAFVSHAWLYPFELLVSALEEAAMPPETFFWVDIAVVNQHTNATRGFDWWSGTFRMAVKHIGQTLLVLAHNPGMSVLGLMLAGGRDEDLTARGAGLPRRGRGPAGPEDDDRRQRGDHAGEDQGTLRGKPVPLAGSVRRDFFRHRRDSAF